MERRMMGNYHVRCEAGENLENPQKITYCYSCSQNSTIHCQNDNTKWFNLTY
mgnify:CR=1 FL=1